MSLCGDEVLEGRLVLVPKPHEPRIWVGLLHTHHLLGLCWVFLGLTLPWGPPDGAGDPVVLAHLSAQLCRPLGSLVKLWSLLGASGFGAGECLSPPHPPPAQRVPHP